MSDQLSRTNRESTSLEVKRGIILDYEGREKKTKAQHNFAEYQYVTLTLRRKFLLLSRPTLVHLNCRISMDETA